MMIAQIGLVKSVLNKGVRVNNETAVFEDEIGRRLPLRFGPTNID
jgi:hypothetical protein